MNYSLKGYCAGILVFTQRDVLRQDLLQVIKYLKQKLRDGEISLNFAHETQVATEICLDVYDEAGKYRSDLSTALK